MKLAISICIIISAILSTGCAMKHAQTAQEFRLMTPKNTYGIHESFTIKNSYFKVVNNFKKRTNKCLNIELVMTTTNRYGQALGVQTLTYTPTLVTGNKHSELSVQKNVSGDGMIMGKIPMKGMFILVADMSPAGKNKTKLDVYRNSYGTDIITSSIKNWATGKSLACPDMTN